MKTLNKLPKVIGVGGCARAGKNTFTNILKNKLKAVGKSVDEFAFADALKQDCDAFCKEKLGVSAFTQDPNEKLLVRPLLVWYGDAKRKQTGGRYWVNIINQKVGDSLADFCIVTDVRYDFYPKDEISWVKDECNGVVVHVSRWSTPTIMNAIRNRALREFVPPANDHERENDPKVKAKSDFVVEWKNVEGLTMAELTRAPSLVAHVDEFITKCNLF